MVSARVQISWPMPSGAGAVACRGLNEVWPRINCCGATAAPWAPPVLELAQVIVTRGPSAGARPRAGSWRTGSPRGGSEGRARRVVWKMVAMADRRFRSEHRLRRSGDFAEVYARRRSASDEVLLVYGRENGLGHPRLGLSVSRKV